MLEIAVVLLSIAIFVLLVGMGLLLRRQRAPQQNGQSNKSRPLRGNVLLLMAAAYISILLIFAVMVVTGTPAKSAFELISVPFVALIGGTLTIAKDLIET